MASMAAIRPAQSGMSRRRGHSIHASCEAESSCQQHEAEASLTVSEALLSPSWVTQLPPRRKRTKSCCLPILCFLAGGEGRREGDFLDLLRGMQCCHGNNLSPGIAGLAGSDWRCWLERPRKTVRGASWLPPPACSPRGNLPPTAPTIRSPQRQLSQWFSLVFPVLN